jgi:isoamylase
MRPDGRRMSRRDWEDGGSRAIGVFLNGDELGSETQQGELLRDNSFLLLFNGHFEPIDYRLPARRFATRWELELATGTCEFEQLVPGASVTVESRSVAVFKRI